MIDHMKTATAQRARRSFAEPVTAPPITPPPAQTPPPAPEAAPAADAPAVRPARKPFGAHVQKLSYPARENYHRHWFNDTPGRIARALEAGYSHVKSHDGKNVSRIVGVAEAGGGGLNAFLMEIPLEWYREDQALKDAKRDEVAAQMKRGAIGDVAPGKDGAYLPTNKAGSVGVVLK
jgi:hypothetical protein